MALDHLSGRCLCGNVTYTNDAEPMSVGICHCEDCQRGCGTSFSTVVLIPAAGFHLEGDTIGTFATTCEDTGAGRERKFCTNCGSPIVTVMADMPDILALKAGTLDDRSWLKPELEVYTDSAQPWITESNREERGLFARGLPT